MAVSEAGGPADRGRGRAAGFRRALTVGGFTAIELIVVLLLVGVVAAVAVSRMVDTGVEAAGEAELLKANLRFAQARAMSEGVDLPEGVEGANVVWGVRIAADSYTLLENGAQATLRFPGGDSARHALEGVTITAGTGDLTFDFRGRPSLAGTELVADHVITVSGGKTVTITAETGFIP